MGRDPCRVRIICSQGSAPRSLLSGWASSILNPKVGEKVRGNTFRSPDRTSILGPPRSRQVQELPAAVLPFAPSSRDNGPKCAFGDKDNKFREAFKMAKKGPAVDSGNLYYANLAVVAEQAGNYEDAAKQWRRASGASRKPDSIVLYEEAAKRCERRSKEEFGRSS